jgi:hypothetical protein
MHGCAVITSALRASPAVHPNTVSSSLPHFLQYYAASDSLPYSVTPPALFSVPSQLACPSPKALHTLSYLRHAAVFENLAGLQIVKKFPAIYGTRKFFTTFTSGRHLSLS